MSTAFHTKVRLDGYKFEAFNLTWNISGAVTKADEGRAIAFDKTAPNTVKLAADGEAIIGRLEIYEARGTCTVAHRFADPFPIKNGAAVAVGDTVVGAGNGTVKAAGAADPLVNYVAEVRSGVAIVVKL